MAFAKINLKPSPRDLRIFACSILIGLGILGSFFYFFHDKTGIAFFIWGYGCLSFIFCITGMSVGLPFYWAWMGIMFALTQLLVYLSLSIIFFFIVTPLGLFARLLGRDRLRLKRKEAHTYWENDVPGQSNENYERQF